MSSNAIARLSTNNTNTTPGNNNTNTTANNGAPDGLADDSNYRMSDINSEFLTELKYVLDSLHYNPPLK